MTLMALSKIVMIITTVVTMALTLTITYESLRNKEISESRYSKAYDDHERVITSDLKMVKLPAKRVIRSRFLVESSSSSQMKTSRAADHCHKDNEICYVLEGRNWTCCNNKCMDLRTDSRNCGACKNKCKYTETCCGGKCVNLAYDKRHCGVCGNKCMPGGYCVYGMCDYA